MKYLTAVLILIITTITITAQEKTISGVVLGENRLPLSTATILVKGTTNTTSSDFNGVYTITAKQGDILVFSYIGYQNKEITIGVKNEIDVSLQIESTLEEVVITSLAIKRGGIKKIKKKEKN